MKSAPLFTFYALLRAQAQSTEATKSSTDNVPPCDPGSRFYDIYYLGRGYDVVRGNPEPWLSNTGGDASQLTFDPGWAVSVVDMNDYSAGKRINGCLVPNVVADSIQNTGSCLYQSDFSEMGDSASYQHSLRAQASFDEHAGAFGWGESFSASGDYQEQHDESMRHKSIYFSSSSLCEFYTATLPEFAAFNLTSDFRRGVNALPTQVGQDEEVLIRFVKQFGTHFTSKITMGAKATILFSLDQVAYSSFSSKGFDISAAMKVSFGCFGGFKGHTSVDEHDSSYQQFEKTNKHTIISCVGANGECPLVDGGKPPEDWRAAAQKAPVPLTYSLRSVADVLTRDYFDSRIEPNISAKQNVLYHFLVNEYCSKVAPAVQAVCKPPDKDGYWSTKADIGVASSSKRAPHAKTDVGVGVLDGYLYAVGGYDGGFSSTVDVYNPSDNTWHPVQSMHIARYRLGVGVLQGKVYAVGGLESGGTNSVQATMEIFDPYGNGWSLGANMTTPRCGLGVAVLDDMLFAVGGDSLTEHHLATMEVYRVSSQKWLPAPSMRQGRTYMGCGALGGKLYVVGGEIANGLTATMEIFDPSTNTWYTGPSMSTPRGYVSVGILRNKIHVVGGGEWCQPDRTSMLTFDTTTQAWSRGSPMLIGRTRTAVGMLGDKMYAVGGCTECTNSSNWIASVESFWNASEH